MMTDPNSKTRGLTPGGKRDKAKLTDLERAFALHYVGAGRGIASESLRLAGSKAVGAGLKRGGYELLQRERVILEIDRLREARAERLSITADEVLLDLVAVRDKARLLPGTSANLKVELAAIEKIGDHVGVAAFRKQVGLAGPDGGPIQVEDLSRYTDEELEQLERARAILDGAPAPGDPQRGGSAGGTGAATQGA